MAVGPSSLLVIDELEARYRRNRDVLIEYLKSKADQADWHAVADAACDLRELQARRAGESHAGEK